jgi:hypothetical protein
MGNPIRYTPKNIEEKSKRKSIQTFRKTQKNKLIREEIRAQKKIKLNEGRDK